MHEQASLPISNFREPQKKKKKATSNKYWAMVQILLKHWIGYEICLGEL